MSDYPVRYDQGGACESTAKMIGMPSLKIRLEQAVAAAEYQLNEAKRAREIFDRNPDLEELMNIMQRGRF